ncbi:MAG: hypothetical protein ACXVAY_03090 [Mucilaginibacter sp.]
MKKDKEKAFDDLFKAELGNPANEAGYREADWDAFEKMLDGPKKRPGIIFWLPILSSAAALLLVIGWWLFKPQAAKQNHQQQTAVVKGINTKGQTITGAKPAQNGTQNSAVNPSLLSVQLPVKTGGSNTQPIINARKRAPLGFVAKGQNTGVAHYTPSVNPGSKDNDAALPNTKNAVLPSRDQSELLAFNSGLNDDKAPGNEHAINGGQVVDKDIVGNVRYNPYLPKNESNTTKLGFVRHPQLALAFIGASELNSVDMVGGSKAGTNLGVLFSAGLFNKFTITTGATYSTKPYNTNAANYHTAYVFKTNPTSIEADCRVLDIPINVDYQLYNKHQNKFSIGTGLSSYIMLHESYQYYYADPYAKGPKNYTVANPGKYFFGIANLQATYQRQINSKVGLSIQPYLKLPLANIGYSQARLQTMGVAIGLNWNLNSLTKP